MLVRFSTRNYRSFGSEDLSLEFIASSKERIHETHQVKHRSGAKLLKNTVVYGGNASGKTNIVKALRYAVLCIREGRVHESGRDSFCKVFEGARVEETVFDLQFAMRDSLFDYGFSCILNTGRVVSEWLYDLNGERPRPIFEWDGEEMNPALSEIAAGDDLTRVGVYYGDFRESSDKLFLRQLGVVKEFSASEDLMHAQAAWRWLSRCIQTVGTKEHRARIPFYEETELQRVADVLASFDTGICGLENKNVSFEEFRGMVPSAILETLAERIEDLEKEGGDSGLHALSLRGPNEFLGIARNDTGGIEYSVMRIKHQESFYDYSFGEESDGTQRLLDFVDMLFSKQDEVVYVVDELNRCFHPMLTQHFVEVFNEIHAADKCQLVFTTHEDAIMSLDNFRRDEIWFVERHDDGCSHLYSLDDFDIRSDNRVGKRYMEGRYGGIPILSVQGSIRAFEGR